MSREQQKQGKQVKGSDGAEKVIVVVKASKEIPRTALVWSLTHVVQPGDCITLLVVGIIWYGDPCPVELCLEGILILNFMELMQQVKGYSDSREEEEEEEAVAAEEEEIITREESCRLLHEQQDAAPSNFVINSNNNIHTTKQLDFMDLSLGSNKGEANSQRSGAAATSSSCSSSSSPSCANNGNNLLQQPAEKEHMFDKVVTPSDVGKLNRLVIPKQHAEKYFPLDSNANEKGMLLNFEDRNGKLWRFRYSYWNSSQSYVMTKGWSRFVKEKKLDAGDIVSFQRGVGELYRHRLYIDWRRRPDHHHHHGPDPSTTLFTPFFLPNQPHLMSIRWGSGTTSTNSATGRFYSLPSPTLPHHHHDHFQQHLNYNTMYHHHQNQNQNQNPSFYHHQHQNYQNNELGNSSSGSASSVFYLRSTTPSMSSMADHHHHHHQQQQQGLMMSTRQQQGGNVVSLSPMIIDSVPIAHHNNNQHHHHHHQHVDKSGSSGSSSTAGKRLRLFGVNMECASSTTSSSEDPKCFSLLSSSSLAMANSNSSLPPLQLLKEDTFSSPSARFGDQKGEASMFFDLDPSLQYRQ
ncbi:hypothetical protein RJT34_17459 [Clitoria ternatea]|uniref:TF-B3 domain-containing protein n=1 Tax=Clitoria ternatea TaxID=43366 RepID=A0AAN9J909_CLITE